METPFGLETQILREGEIKYLADTTIWQPDPCTLSPSTVVSKNIFLLG